jgi:CubicO group peptidase (beta-lactamase class C family)
VNGELVLDLVGVVDKEHTLSQQYSASSLQNIFSSSKAVASIVVAMLVDRGHLQYESKIADIWPGRQAGLLHSIHDTTRHDTTRHDSTVMMTD